MKEIKSCASKDWVESFGPYPNYFKKEPMTFEQMFPELLPNTESTTSLGHTITISIPDYN